LLPNCRICDSSFLRQRLRRTVGEQQRHEHVVADTLNAVA
jgi:hypothetical protein